MASNVSSAVASKAGEYNLVDSQEQSEKSCCQKIKKVASDCLESISNFFKKVLSFLKEHCCCGKKSEEAIGQATETSSVEGKTEGKLEAKPQEIQKEEEFTEEELEAFGKELNAYFSDENINACLEEEGLSKEKLEALSKEQQYELIEKRIERVMANFVTSKGGKSLSEDAKKLAKEFASLISQIGTEEDCAEEWEPLILKMTLCLLRLCK